ncbi:hypothetical protein X801_02333, partial [Opisthorchis viverrini]
GRRGADTYVVLNSGIHLDSNFEVHLDPICVYFKDPAALGRVPSNMQEEAILLKKYVIILNLEDPCSDGDYVVPMKNLKFTGETQN